MGSEARRKGGVGTAQAFAYAASVLVVAAVIGGMYLAGSPAKERSRQLDQRRVNDLLTLASQVDSYYEHASNRLPTEINSPADTDLKVIFTQVDPATGAAYEYRATGDSTYELCATFDMESGPLDAYGNPRVKGMTAPMDPYSLAMGQRSWEHGAGRHCFTLDAKDGITRTSCGITSPCAAGQSCVTLPDRDGAVCVPQGRECDAAMCGDAGCVIAESYPAQVRCAGGSETPTPSPKKPAGSSTCDLMQDPKSGKVDCFGCANGVCTSAPDGWKMHFRDPEAMGIPYACYETDSGCALAQ